MPDVRDTLILPFTNGSSPMPKQGESWSFLNASPLPHDASDWMPALSCEQPSRSEFRALEAANYSVAPALELASIYDGAFVLAGRNRRMNEAMVARAWNGLKENGQLIVAGEKTTGIAPLKKWMASFAPDAVSLSKHHAVAVSCRKSGDNISVPNLALTIDGYTLAHGMFSAKGPDAGSKVLVEHLPTNIKGRVADFGAGWGYLAKQVLASNPAIETIELYESDWNALEAAKRNVVDRALFHWCDLTAEAPRGPFNTIIMNPPFHAGRQARPDIGVAFIEAAARALPSGGRLYLVANVNLPYENTLQTAFKKVERIAQTNGFKVIAAIR